MTDYGIPASGNLGRFGYSRGTRPSGGWGSPVTLTWLPEVGSACLLPPPEVGIIIMFSRRIFIICTHLFIVITTITYPIFFEIDVLFGIFLALAMAFVFITNKMETW